MNITKYKYYKYKYKLSNELFNMYGGDYSIKNKIIKEIRKILYIYIYIDIEKLFENSDNIVPIDIPEFKRILKDLNNNLIQLYLNNNLTKLYISYTKDELSYNIEKYIKIIIGILNLKNFFNKHASYELLINLFLLITRIFIIPNKIILDKIGSNDDIINILQEIDKDLIHTFSSNPSIKQDTSNLDKIKNNIIKNFNYFYDKFFKRIIFKNVIFTNKPNSFGGVNINEIYLNIHYEKYTLEFDNLLDTKEINLDNDKILGNHITILTIIYNKIENIINKIFDYLFNINDDKIKSILDILINIINILGIFDIEYKKFYTEISNKSDIKDKVDLLTDFSLKQILNLFNLLRSKQSHQNTQESFIQPKLKESTQTFKPPIRL